MRNVMILLLTVMVVVMLTGPVSAEITEAPYHTTLEAARQAADGRPILVDFYTDW